MLVSVSEKIKFISSFLGKVKEAGNAADVAVRCPFSDCPSQKKLDKFKLAIRIADDWCHCWVCSFRSRSLLPLLFKFGTREQLLEYKTKFAPEHVIVPEKAYTSSSFERFQLPGNFRLLALEGVESSDYAIRRAVNYLLNQRGLSENDLWYYKFVVSDDWKWKCRVIVPSFNAEGDLNYYTGRQVVDDSRYHKYKNCDVNSETIVFNELNVDWKKPLILVEGPFDLLKCKNLNATCLLGSNLNEHYQIFDRLLYYQTPVVLCFDGDVKEKTMKLARKLVQYNLDVKIAPTGDRDPGLMSLAEVEDLIGNAKPWNWHDHVLQRIKKIQVKL